MKVSIAPQRINHHDRARQTDGSQRAPGARENGQKEEKREQKTGNEGKKLIAKN